MQSTLLDRLRSRFRKLARNPAVNEKAPSGIGGGNAESSPQIQILNPVENFYQHKLRTNLPDFSRFALQSQSLAIRDVFALVASTGQQGIVDLLATLESGMSSYIFELYDTEILLALADLLANGARNDLDTHAALQIYDLVYTRSGPQSFQDHQKLQYMEALGEADRYENLRRVAHELSLHDLAPLQYELLNIQKARKASSSGEGWLKSMNELYASLGMSEIRLSGDQTLPLLDRLRSDTTERIDGPQVSVIMPTFSPGPGIRTAIRSLLEQTWQNIEIIVVDDASPQEFRYLFSELEALDPRVQVIRQEENSGAYPARNRGLSVATGEFATTHDDDDWSHPDKIAAQARALVGDKSLVATTSAHIRTTQGMYFQRVNARAHYMQMNYSSLMFRRSVSDEIGPWDTVNRGGDSEFLNRVIENFGSENVTNLMEKPLSFSRVWKGSLTSGEMSRGFFAYSRLLYRWSFRQWQWDMAKAGKKAVRKPDEPRPYAVPTTFEPRNRNKDLGLFDVIYVTDFFRQSKFVSFVLNDIEALVQHEFRVGFMHLNSPQTNRPAGFPPQLFAMQREGHITQVSHDDVAETKLLIVYDASIGMFADQLQSSVVSGRSIVIDHELPGLAGGEVRSASTIARILQHLDKAFDTMFEVVGATDEDQGRLLYRAPNRRRLPDSFVWDTHLAENPGEITAPTSTPIVGFHSYGNKYRWPTNKGVFESIYVSERYRTRLFGSLEPARLKFGDEIINQLEVVPSSDWDEEDFLSDIDFWIYFPHHRLEDQLWRPVLSAMQAGAVVILPSRLEHLYGSGAIYVEPSEVTDTVERLSGDPESYLAQARHGQQFVADRFTHERFESRVRRLLE